MKRKRAQPATYSLLDELAASPTEPLPEKIRSYQLLRMWQGLSAIEQADRPSTDDWRVCSDAVNLMEMLVAMGEIQDASGLLQDAITALALAGKRNLQGKPIRLDAPGMQAVRAVLEDYAMVLESLPARTMIRCHRLTERRIRDILAGKKQPHDVEIVDL